MVGVLHVANELTSVVIEAGALPKLDSLKLGCHHHDVAQLQIIASPSSPPARERCRGCRNSIWTVDVRSRSQVDNHLQPDVVRSVVNAPFSKSLTILSLFSRGKEDLRGR